MMKLNCLSLVVIIVAKFNICNGIRYENFALYSVTPEDVEQLKFLQNLQKQKYINVIFWTRPVKLFYEVQFMVSPNDKELFMERARHFKLNTTILIPNVQQAFDNQIIKRYLHLKVDSYTWEYYHTLEDIYQWLSDLALKFPNIVELYVIGTSVEGREIFTLTIKRGNPKNKVIVEGGVHGNEWISVEFVNYLAAQLIYANHVNDRLQKLFRSYVWYLVPIANPDGYTYNQREDRLFKKNRNVTDGKSGVDLNRNFDYSFGQNAVGKNVHDDNYCGSAAFSEPESVALRNFIQRNSNNLKFYFSIHGYGQKLVIPFSDRVNHIDNYAEMENYGKQAILKMYELYGRKYSVGTFYDTLDIDPDGGFLHL